MNNQKTNKQKITTAFILIILAALMSSVGQFFWKLGANSESIGILFFYLIGFIATGIGMFVMMASFRFGQVSILQPMMSIGYAFSIVIGYLFLNEPITLYKFFGTLFIIVGAVLLGMEESTGEAL